MRLDHAVKRALKLADSGTLAPEDAVAVHVLAKMCRRIMRAKKPIASLNRALNPEEAHLNQQSMFGED